MNSAHWAWQTKVDFLLLSLSFLAAGCLSQVHLLVIMGLFWVKTGFTVNDSVISLLTSCVGATVITASDKHAGDVFSLWLCLIWFF